MSSLGKKATTLAHSAHPFQDFRHRQQLERTQQPLQEKDGGLYWYWPSGNIDIHYHRLVDRKPHFRDKKALEREHNRSRIKFAIYQKTVSSPGWTDQKKNLFFTPFCDLANLLDIIHHSPLHRKTTSTTGNKTVPSSHLFSFMRSWELWARSDVPCASSAPSSLFCTLQRKRTSSLWTRFSLMRCNQVCCAP